MAFFSNKFLEVCSWIWAFILRVIENWLSGLVVQNLENLFIAVQIEKLTGSNYILKGVWNLKNEDHKEVEKVKVDLRILLE